MFYQVNPHKLTFLTRSVNNKTMDTIWLFNIAMENDPFIDDFPIKTSIYSGFSMAMLNNQRVCSIAVQLCGSQGLSGEVPGLAIDGRPKRHGAQGKLPHLSRQSPSRRLDSMAYVEWSTNGKPLVFFSWENYMVDSIFHSHSYIHIHSCTIYHRNMPWTWYPLIHVSGNILLDGWKTLSSSDGPPIK